MTITLDNLPRLAGRTWADAKAWFSALRPHASGTYVRGWNLDDGFRQTNGLTPEAAAAIRDTARRIAADSKGWASPSSVYDLCGDAKVVAEDVWPGFQADVFTSASRTGHVSVRDRELPNFVIEEFNGEFYLLEFTTVGPISECPLFRLSLLEGAAMDSFKTASPSEHIDISAAVVVEGTTMEFDRIEDHDDIIAEIHDREKARIVASLPKSSI